MANTQFQNHEGQSSNRPPLLIGSENYNFWKFRMKIYLQKDPFEWYAVETGFPTPIDTEGFTKSLFDMDDKETMNTILSGLSQIELDKVSSCKTSKEM